MNTILVWLLISLPGCPTCNSNVPSVTIAKFADVEECQRVAKILSDFARYNAQPTKCIQARIVP